MSSVQAASGASTVTASARGGGEDLTGLDRLAWNVLASWGGHLVFIVAGFVMPRLIDRGVGQAGLGIWDFGWSFVSYFSLAGIGIGSSVNRHVALHRARGDAPGLRRTVSSLVAVNLCVSVVVLALTAIFTMALPALFGQRLGPHLADARWVLALLGVSLAVQMAFDTFRGVISGCHRWDLHNGINAAFHGLTVLGMAGALALGGGLRALAAAHLIGTAAAELTRLAFARRVCPELEVRLADARWEEARGLIHFGAKASLIGLSRVLLIQTTSLLVAAQLGPSALALFTRPVALLRQLGVVGSKFAVVLTPTVSSLQGAGRHGDLRELLLEGTRFGTALILPLLTTVVILGDPIVRLWMGPRYEPGLVLPILAAGFALPFCQQAALNTLIGLNEHGRLAMASLVAATLGAGAAAVILGPFGGGLEGAALAMALPLAFGDGAFIAVFACRALHIPLGAYLNAVFLRPALAVCPYAASLVLVRWTLGERPLQAVGAAVVLAVVVMLPMAWRFALTERMREALWSRATARERAR